MSESFITFLGIYFLSLFKFIAGPVLGSAAGYGVVGSITVTVAGMMTSVVLFTLIGSKFKDYLKLRFNKKKPIFSKKNRALVKVWKKYGQVGIAAITPLVLTPIGGTLIMVSFGAKKRHIYLNMLLSSLFWATIFCLSIDQILTIPFFQKLLG
ncbi:hypothetical protein FHS59_002845 [Algoriphagus iocasae]|uniref:Small multi-drug export protein n=1 Tax=Algoriphagus iocasae TaxID=1836499 RepID=A0A841MNY9_9BACT|nr:hypothetical protein [Algoriphagus iocasae]MBB6327217.1 hypothetical protein [Algoriphagus iocasae]